MILEVCKAAARSLQSIFVVKLKETIYKLETQQDAATDDSGSCTDIIPGGSYCTKW